MSTLSGLAYRTIANPTARLRAIGKLEEAIEPTQVGMEIHISEGLFTEAALAGGSLSELYGSLGRISESISCGIRAVTLAQTGGRLFRQVAELARLAVVLHFAGRPIDAKEHAKRVPDYPQLFAVAGYRYCSSVLDGVDTRADNLDKNTATIRDVRRRCWQAIEASIERGHKPLVTAMFNEILGRSHLLE